MAEIDAPAEILEHCGCFIVLLSDDAGENDLHLIAPEAPAPLPLSSTSTPSTVETLPVPLSKRQRKKA